MKCRVCGAEIGDKKVCPYCKEPIQNVLVENCSVSTDNKKFVDEGTTIIKEGDSFTASIEVKDETKCESQNIIEKEEKWKSVIPDFENKKNNITITKKKKIFIICAILVTLSIIFIFTVYFVAQNKYKAYVKKLKDIKVTFTEIGSTPPVFKNEFEDGSINGFISSNSKYKVFLKIDKEKKWIKDSSESGGHNQIFNNYNIYIIGKSGEKINVYSEEKETGKIKLIGINNEGDIYYNDTEKMKSYIVTYDSQPKEIGEMVSKVICYDDNDLYFMSDNQLILSSSDDSQKKRQVISSNVTDVYYIDGNKFYGYLKSVKGVTSTSTKLKIILYSENEKIYKRNIENNMIGGEKIDHDVLNNLDRYILLDTKLNKIDVSKKDLSGSGSVVINKKGNLIYYNRIYRRNLGKADKIIAISGENVYAMRNDKLYKINIFTKKQIKLYDKEMILIIE